MNQHPDDLAVDRFAAAMKEKLALARTKGRSGWEQCDPANLSAMLHEHVAKGDPRDVANFCMFLWNRGKPISPCRAIQDEPFMPLMQFRIEIARLTECLERANSQAEHFEREWYLRGDEIEALKAEKNKQAEPVGYIHKDDLKELLSDNAIGHHWLTVLFTLSDPDVVALYTHPAPAVAQEPVACVLAEVAKATAKFPTWPTDPLHALAVLGEEFGELTQAVLQSTYEPHKSTPDDVKTEAIQTAAMAMRFLMSHERYEYAKSEQHVQGEHHGKN